MVGKFYSRTMSAEGAGAGEHVSPEPVAPVEIRIVTPHGEPVPGAEVVFRGGGAECHAVEDDSTPGLYGAALLKPDDYLLIVSRYQKPGGFDHRTLRTVLFYHDRPRGRRLLSLDPPAGERPGVVEIQPDGAGFRLLVRLDYLWFTPIGFPPTQGNRVDVLVDGEDGWRAVVQAIEQAQTSVHVTTWIYQPTTELLRPDPLADPSERERYTVHRMLEARAQAGVTVRLLLWDAPFLPMLGPARRAARSPDDNFEVLQEANPAKRPLLEDNQWHLYNLILGDFEIGSHHQKSVVVDGTVGFCTGMNLKENDWDGGVHRVFNPARCRFNRSAAFRREVQECRRRADYRPRHDFIARVEGPAVEHLQENFRERWNRLIENKAKHSDRATPAPDPEPIAPGAGPSQVQVIRTMPDPVERGILDTYLRAIGTARRLIYIEDQYFRSVHISEAIADAVRTWPELEVIVTTSQGQANQRLAGSWTRECFDRIRQRKPDFELFALRIAEMDAVGRLVLEEVDNHAKLMIIDDLFLSVGSCNMNDRGFEYEGELNLAVVDADLARRVRLDVWRLHLEGDARLSGEITNDVAIWKEHAEQNRVFDRRAGQMPTSHVFPFEPRASRLLLFGRDVF